MPDWSYRTVFRPVLFRLPVDWARTIALRGIGTIAHCPGGRWLISQLGHMQPPRELAWKHGPLPFPSRVGLGHRLDPQGHSRSALELFGFGAIEVGPVSLTARHDQLHLDLQRQDTTWKVTSAADAITASTVVNNLAERRSDGPVLLLRWRFAEPFNAAQVADLWSRISPYVDAVVCEGTSSELVRLAAALDPPVPLIRLLTIESPLPDDLLSGLQSGACHGVLFEDGESATEFDQLDNSCANRTHERQAVLRTQVADLRQRIGPHSLLLVRGCVVHPLDVLELRDAGADIILIDHGMIASGPGLAKRINEAEAARLPVSVPISPPAIPESWVWTSLLGVSLLGGGCLALSIAFTRVMLPYDEDFVGMNREQLCGVNGRLIDFMSHDRVTLSGTMISLGLVYLMLSLFGSRRGRHWAKIAILASAFTGFFSFFAFLGYGYFDPFHAFVAAILFQFQLFGLASPLSPLRDRPIPTLREDRAWRVSQWGQLILLGHAVALLVAGLVIVAIGSTSVFVREDLDFMATTAEQLRSANPKIIPLVAHDRASFGGMLIGCGLSTLLPVLWGFERGRPWLWWMLLLAGVAGYLPAIAVHYAVGYTSGWHLAPAFAGAAVLVVGLLLSRRYLCNPCGATTGTRSSVTINRSPVGRSTV